MNPLKILPDEPSHINRGRDSLTIRITSVIEILSNIETTSTLKNVAADPEKVDVEPIKAAAELGKGEPGKVASEPEKVAVGLEKFGSEPEKSPLSREKSQSWINPR